MADIAKASKSPAALRKLFDDPAIWKAFVTEQRRRDALRRVADIEELERAVLNPGATRQDRINLNVAIAVHQALCGRDAGDEIGAPQGTA